MTDKFSELTSFNTLTSVFSYAQLFKFLSRRTDSSFCKTILRRLVASRTMRPPVSLSKLVKHLGGKQGRTAVVVGTVTDDMRLLDLPKLEVAALRFTEGARARITKAGGSCLTIDELIMKCPSGTPRPSRTTEVFLLCFLIKYVIII